MSNIMQSILYKDFVTPSICRELSAAGLDANLPFFWRVHKGAVLKCYVFDYDDYYQLNDVTVDQLNPPKAFWPAFQICDLDKLLPDYFIQKRDGLYCMTVNKSYNLALISNSRLPDLFATMVLAMLKQGLLQPIMSLTILNNNHA